MKFYVAVASAIAARNHCEQRSMPMVAEWDEYIDYIVREHAPSGAGFDSGTRLNVDRTQIGGNKPQRLVFDTAFHHMNEAGYYTHWTHHEVWVYPWFDGFNVRITGRDDNSVKDLIADTFHLIDATDVMTIGDYRAAQQEQQAKGT